MEAFRALGLFAERPSASHAPAIAALDLGAPPDDAEFTEVMLLQLPPYASIYLGGDGMIGGAARDRIAGFWRALGLAPPDEPDHLATMLATHAALAEWEAAQRDAARREACHRARVTFFREHLASWLPPYLDAVEALGAPAYRRWAALLGRLVADEARALGAAETLPGHLADAPPLDGATRDGLVDGLLAPARSGVILARADLARCARDLGLGAGVRDRRLMLRELIAQDGGALAWLAAEAGGWVARHRRRAAEGAARRWAERAAATQRLLTSLEVDRDAGEDGRI